MWKFWEFPDLFYFSEANKKKTNQTVEARNNKFKLTFSMYFGRTIKIMMSCNMRNLWSPIKSVHFTVSSRTFDASSMSK